MVSVEKREDFSVIWAPNPQVSCSRHERYISRKGYPKPPAQEHRVCGNPAVTHTSYLHPPSWFLSCFLCLFQNDSSNSTCSSKTKHCLVRQCMTLSHTQHLPGNVFVTTMLMPQEQCFTCKIEKCQIYLCLSKDKSFPFSFNSLMHGSRFALAYAADDRYHLHLIGENPCQRAQMRHKNDRQKLQPNRKFMLIPINSWGTPLPPARPRDTVWLMQRLLKAPAP